MYRLFFSIVLVVGLAGCSQNPAHVPIDDPGFETTQSWAPEVEVEVETEAETKQQVASNANSDSQNHASK